MKLQLALDRINLEHALHLAKLTSNSVDVIEVGTSLIKEFGLSSVQEIKKSFPNHQVLADLKTIDEGAYEFKAAYEAGADIATVMGASAIDTIAACYEVAESFGRTMLIDLLEVGAEKTKELLRFENAIYCVHAPSDQKEKQLIRHLRDFKEQFPEAKRLATAGGVQLEQIEELKEIGLEIVIVGSAITKQEQAGDAAEQFYKAMNGE